MDQLIIGNVQVQLNCLLQMHTLEDANRKLYAIILMDSVVYFEAKIPFFHP